ITIRRAGAVPPRLSGRRTISQPGFLGGRSRVLFLGRKFLRGLLSASRLEAEDSGVPAASGGYSSAGAGTFDYRKRLRLVLHPERASAGLYCSNDLQKPCVRRL